MTNADNGFRHDAGTRVLMINQNDAASPCGASVAKRNVRNASQSKGKRVAPRFRQRDLTMAMKAAKAAGMASFELVDVQSGFIVRAFTALGPEVLTNKLDLELARFKERFGG